MVRAGSDQPDAEQQATDLAAQSVDMAYMNRRPSRRFIGRAGHTHLARPIRELAAALDQEQATSTVTYTATVAPQARGPALGGMTASLSDRFVA
jgi:hypothetical protein